MGEGRMSSRSRLQASDVSQSPTITSPANDYARRHPGTAAYMTPTGARQTRGQARGHLGVRMRALRDADRKSAFVGDDVS